MSAVNVATTNETRTSAHPAAETGGGQRDLLPQIGANTPMRVAATVATAMAAANTKASA